MVIMNYEKKFHKQIIRSAVLALKQGKVVAYPTDTSYGLAVDANNIRAIKKLYKVKGRDFNKAVSIVVPSLAYAKKVVRWNKAALRLAKKFWPGPLTILLPSRRWLPSGPADHFLGLRFPKNQIALDLAKHLGQPITATSANVSGKPDCYSAADITAQFKKQKHEPDIIINAGKLPKRKPSTLVKIVNNKLEILRLGPITQKQIFNAA